MTIKKLEDGRYELDCRPEGRDGPRIRKILRTKNEAMNYQNRIMGDGARGEFEKKQKRDERRLSTLVTLWFDGHGRALKRGEERRRSLESMAECMGDPCAADFSTTHFAAYRADRLSGKFSRKHIGSGRKKGEAARPVCANTVNHELAYLRAMFNELRRLGHWEGDNPLGTVRKLKFDETEMAYLSTEEIPILLTDLDARSVSAGLIARVCLSTGARWSEAQGLKPNQVRDQRVHFLRTKSAKNRAVPISVALAKLLKGFLPFPPSYKKFGESVDSIGLELPPGQLTRALHDERRGHPDAAARPRTCITDDDHEVCAFQPGPPCGCGHLESTFAN